METTESNNTHKHAEVVPYFIYLIIMKKHDMTIECVNIADSKNESLRPG
jgi:hypothetical protein